MAFPFSMFNIAYLTVGIKSETHIDCNVVVKVACCRSFSFRRSPEASDTKTQSHYCAQSVLLPADSNPRIAWGKYFMLF